MNKIQQALTLQFGSPKDFKRLVANLKKKGSIPKKYASHVLRVYNTQWKQSQNDQELPVVTKTEEKPSVLGKDE
jgi:predicted DNA-binding ribbon-helix-helix protein